ncbi:MAG: ATP-binding protein [Pseudomonadales bacterium]|nr:ATP-binding protein [Pseudomonadales bacterium]
MLSCYWIIKKQNLLITKRNECGKTYLACTPGNHAFHHDYSLRDNRATRPLEILTISHGDGSY